MHEYETEIEIDGDLVEVVVEYEWDDEVTGDQVTGAVALITGVYMIAVDGDRVDITDRLSGAELDRLAPEPEVSPSVRRRWERNRWAALYGPL